ncbi:uncharacterized protein EV422DRAFT_500275, partial [Fimicolochytrium jonesii]|uniref:uncharacterized protein n=1 Tax=Fimicolochytrium jonesii TaxID=1396493 RepID=UPI0022FEAA31
MQQDGYVQQQQQSYRDIRPQQQQQQQHSHASSGQSRSRTANSTSTPNQCANCGTLSTPLWRRGSNGETICNACGLYLKARHTYRPQHMKKRRLSSNNSSTSIVGEESRQPQSGQRILQQKHSRSPGTTVNPPPEVHCINCDTTSTPLWRRDDKGNAICNACGLYYRLHNTNRPVTMSRAVIKRRKR